VALLENAMTWLDYPYILTMGTKIKEISVMFSSPMAMWNLLIALSLVPLSFQAIVLYPLFLSSQDS